MAKKYEVRMKLIDNLEGSEESSIKEAITEALEGFDDLEIDGDINVTFLEEVERTEEDDDEEEED